MIYSEHSFQEVLKLLVIIAAEPELQLKAHGIGNAEEEMAMDLDFHFSQNKDAFLDAGHINIEQCDAINAVLAFFKAKEENEDDPFWYELESNSDWIELRILANKALTALNKQHLNIEVKITENTSWFSKNVTSQQIEINLIGE